MAEWTAWLGGLGSLLILIAYVPQIRHLIERQCTAALSLITWHLWWVGSLLLLVHAFAQADWPFVAVQVVNLAAVSLTLHYARKYEDRTCGECRTRHAAPGKAGRRPGNGAQQSKTAQRRR